MNHKNISTPIFLWVLIHLTSSCGPINPTPELDEHGEVIPQPGAYDTWLKVVDIETSGTHNTLSTRPLLRLVFSHYLDTDSFKSYGGASLNSGGLRHNGTLHYAMTYKTLLWQTNSALVQNLEYTFTPTLDELKSATGAPLEPFDETLTERIYTVDPNLSRPMAPFPQDNVLWSEVEQLFTRRCSSCHGNMKKWPLLNPLTHERMVGQESKQLKRYIVKARDPSNSYLMHKLLPDYPDRLNGAHPPKWGEDPTPLRLEELWMLEQWILYGAKSAM